VLRYRWLCGICSCRFWAYHFAHWHKLTIEQAAALPLALMTAHDAVVTNGRVRAVDTVLVQGASSAVGLASMQIAKNAVCAPGDRNVHLKNAIHATERVWADVVVDPSGCRLIDQVLKATDGQGVNVIVDMVSELL